MVWRTELWRDNFDSIEEVAYVFNFNSLHPVSIAIFTAEAEYLIEIRSNIYEVLNYQTTTKVYHSVSL
jgi:hypothetical protein